MAGTFRPSRGGPGYSLDWEGDFVFATMVEAARRGINATTEAGANMARSEHPWENRTGQTEASVFTKGAVVELVGTTQASTPHVWGEWGVEERPRYAHEDDGHGRMRPVLDAQGRKVYEQVSDYTLDRASDGGHGVLTTLDVALFLEFGTIKMHARSWLYPAWDATKVTLPARIAVAYREVSAAAPSARGARNVAGRFMSVGLPSARARVPGGRFTS